MKEFTEEQKREIKAWYDSKPKVIQDLYDEYPPGTYQMTTDAPYGLSHPGMFVQLNAYNENGTVGIVVMAKDKDADALKHERETALFNNHSEESIAHLHKQDVQVVVLPKYLLKVEDDPEIWDKR